MLTAKQNMIECMKAGGNPDRFVNQYEAIRLLFHPFMLTNPQPQKGQLNVVNAWGITNSFPDNTPGSFPVHTPDKIVVKDIENWKDYVKAPSLTFPQELWDQCKAMYDAVDGTKAFKATFVAPGLFEQTHHLCEMVNALYYYIQELWDQCKAMYDAVDGTKAFKATFVAPGLFEQTHHLCEMVNALYYYIDYENEMHDLIKYLVDGTKAFKATFVAPGLFEQTHHLCEMVNALYYYIDYENEMHDLIKYLTEWELKLAEGICSHLHPDMIFHHDDWGSHDSTFLSPAMFEDYFLESYKEIYGYYKSHGVDYIVHHSDSYAATLVPDMIEMGIDVYQGDYFLESYKEIYGYYKSHGVDYIVHHSDSYAATLVPDMIEMGIDVYQGCMKTNNVPELIRKYGDKISFMGVIENAFVDHEGWSDEECEKVVRETVKNVKRLSERL